MKDPFINGIVKATSRSQIKRVLAYQARCGYDDCKGMTRTRILVSDDGAVWCASDDATHAQHASRNVAVFGEDYFDRVDNREGYVYVDKYNYNEDMLTVVVRDGYGGVDEGKSYDVAKRFKLQPITQEEVELYDLY
jgi:hypothetical protein